MFRFLRAKPAPQPALAEQTRVRHEDYGDGTVLQADGDFLLIQFDGETCPGVGIHVEDVAALPAADDDIVKVTPSAFEAAPPIRTYADGSQTYGPYA